MSESKNKVILEWGLDQVDEKYNNRIVAIFDDTTIWDIQAQGNPIKYLYEYRSRDSIGNDSWVKSDLSVCLGDLLYSINTGDFEVPYNLENFTKRFDHEVDDPDERTSEDKDSFLVF